jgi:hypothetical protein
MALSSHSHQLPFANGPVPDMTVKQTPTTFSINITLDGCVEHREGIADLETHAFFTRLMDQGGAMLWGRVTYELMEGHWPAPASSI